MTNTPTTNRSAPLQTWRKEWFADMTRHAQWIGWSDQVWVSANALLLYIPSGPTRRAVESGDVPQGESDVTALRWLLTAALEAVRSGKLHWRPLSPAASLAEFEHPMRPGALEPTQFRIIRVQEPDERTSWRIDLWAWDEAEDHAEQAAVWTVFIEPPHGDAYRDVAWSEQEAFDIVREFCEVDAAVRDDEMIDELTDGGGHIIYIDERTPSRDETGPPALNEQHERRAAELQAAAQHANTAIQAIANGETATQKDADAAIEHAAELIICANRLRSLAPLDTEN